MNEQQVHEFLRNFSSILWEAFPFVVLGAIIAGILEEVVPQQALTRFVPHNKIFAVGLGGILGLVFPMCECGIVPVMRRLLRKGLPLGTCVAYMMAGPIINVVVIGSTVVAFEKYGLAIHMTSLRVGLGFVVAVVTGLLVEYQYRKYGDELLTPVSRPERADVAEAPVLQSRSVFENVWRFLVGAIEYATYKLIYRVVMWHVEQVKNRRLLKRYGNISETALHDFKDIMVFLMLGAVLASLSKNWVTDEQARSISTNAPAIAILAMMALAVLMCLCSEADAFVAASLNVHPSAKLAFLVLGPMFDLKLLLMFTRVFRRRLILTIVISAVIQVFVYTLIVHYLWQAFDIPWTRISVDTNTQTLEQQYGK